MELSHTSTISQHGLRGRFPPRGRPDCRRLPDGRSTNQVLAMTAAAPAAPLTLRGAGASRHSLTTDGTRARSPYQLISQYTLEPCSIGCGAHGRSSRCASAASSCRLRRIPRRHHVGDCQEYRGGASNPRRLSCRVRMGGAELGAPMSSGIKLRVEGNSPSPTARRCFAANDLFRPGFRSACPANVATTMWRTNKATQLIMQDSTTGLDGCFVCGSNDAMKTQF